MTYEEILKKYQVMVYVHDHNVQVNWVKVSDALKAMAEAVKNAIIDFQSANKEANELMNSFQKGAEAKIIRLESELAAKDKEIAELNIKLKDEFSAGYDYCKEYYKINDI